MIRRLGAVLALVLAVLVVFDASAAKPKETLIQGTIIYQRRDCYRDADRVATPLPDALLVLSRARAASVAVRLDGKGRFTARIAGTGPIQGLLVFDGPRLRITPNTAGGLSYKILLGALKPAQGQTISLKGNAAAGAANIWTVLNEGAALGARVSPVALPKLTARWRYDFDLGQGRDEGDTYYDFETNEIFVGGDPTERHEWERRVLLHEYGHHVHWKVAHPGPRAAGDHDLAGVYPDLPGLAWSEGFAQALAAVAMRTGILTRDCQKVADLRAVPARPKPDNPRLAQYNETRAAGALYHLMDYGGGRDVEKGLKRLLGAVHGYRVDGHPPWRMREVRDALIADGWEANDPQRHLEITRLFARQGLAWGLFAQLFDADIEGGAGSSIELIVRGPYGVCTSATARRIPTLLSQEQAPGFVGADGGLPYTWQDECLVDADLPDPSGGSSTVWEFDLHFPYLANQAHRRGQFTLSAVYRCLDDEEAPCSATVRSNFHVWNGQAVLDPRAMRGNEILSRQGLPERAQVSAPSGVTLRRGVETVLLRWGAVGTCTILGPPEVDCSV